VITKPTAYCPGHIITLVFAWTFLSYVILLLRYLTFTVFHTHTKSLHYVDRTHYFRG